MKKNEIIEQLSSSSITSNTLNIKNRYILALKKAEIYFVNDKPVEELNTIELFLAYDEFIFLDEGD